MADRKKPEEKPINVTSLALGAALGAAMGAAGHGPLATLAVITGAFWGVKILFPSKD